MWFNPNVNVLDALPFIANVTRQLWSQDNGIIPDIMDCTVFAGTYLMHRFKMNGCKIRLTLQEEPLIEKCIKDTIYEEWTKITLLGNGYESRPFWMEEAFDVNHTYGNALRESDYGIADTGFTK